MLTRDAYIARLEKRAETAAVHSTVDGPTSIDPNNSAEATRGEYDSIREDNRKYLEGLFSRSSDVERDQSRMAKDIFPEGDGTRIYGNPFMKKASFYGAIQEMGLLKTASPLHLEVAFSAFQDELGKIGTY